MLRLGAMGAAGAILSTAASSSVLQLVPGPQGLDPLAPLQAAPQRAVVQAPTAPAGIDPQLFARAKAALDSHGIAARDSIGIADFSQPSSEPRFHVVDLANGTVESHMVCHGRGSDPDHSGYVERFSNDFGSYATSNGTYVTTTITTASTAFRCGSAASTGRTTTPSRARSSSTMPGTPSRT